MDIRTLELSDAIKKLIGDRSIRQTAMDTGVSASYLSGILKGKYLPSAEVLRKLSSHQAKPRNGITMETLMKIAGYKTEEINMENDCEVTSAKEMRSIAEKSGRLMEIKKHVAIIMKKIRKASTEGECKVYFTPPQSVYEDVKIEFEKNGYIFKPVGIEGGVWQDCEYICW